MSVRPTCSSAVPPGKSRARFSEALIRAVRRRPPLWDLQDKYYKDSEHKALLWAEAARELGSEVSAIKLKWKGLRDTFRKHFKISRDGSRREAGADETRGTTWKFFKHMLFLSDVVDVGWSSGNLQSPGDAADVNATNLILEPLPSGSASFNAEACEFLDEDLEGDCSELPVKQLALEPSHPCSSSPTQLPARKKRKMPVNVDLNRVSEPLSWELADHVDHYCAVLGTHMRNCPEHLLGELEIELLQTTLRYARQGKEALPHSE